MKKIAILVVMFLATVLTFAEPQDMQIRVLSSTSDSVKVEITIPGYQMNKVMADGKECVVVHIPGASYLMQQGFPLVPRVAKLVSIHERCDVSLNILEKEEVEVELPAPIIPSKGHLTRNVNPDEIAFEFGPIYKQDAYWPDAKNQFTIGKPFVFRDTRGVRIEILPILANHVQMKMKVLKRAVLEVSCTQSRKLVNALENKSKRAGKHFRKLYQESFINYQEEPVMERAGTVPPESNKRLVVVVPTSFESAIANWVTWKRQCGYVVTVYAVPSGVTADTIKAKLQEYYNDTNTRPGYVVLIGDASGTSFTSAQPMPTFSGKYEGAACDRTYVRLAGSDNYPDAFISRISGTTAAHITDQLDKIVKYEQSPITSTDWFTKGTCIASDQGSPTDKERTEWLQNGGGTGQKVPVVDKGLIGYGYTSFDDIYDPSASASQITNAVNSGRSIILYIGHGSDTSWGTTGFSTSNVNGLSNGGMLPVIWSVACVNGNFAKVGTCFAEAWLRKANGGAVAMEAASTNEAWVPPCDKQAATVNAIIRKTHYTFGGLEAVGVVKGLEVWGDTDSSQGNQMADQCNLFGDCTMMVRTTKPQAITVQPIRADNSIVFQVTAEERSAMATVTVYTADFSFMVSADVDESGNVTLPLENAPADAKLFYTVVGPDLIPEIDKEL